LEALDPLEGEEGMACIQRKVCVAVCASVNEVFIEIDTLPWYGYGAVNEHGVIRNLH
jgi:hypothetical protein